MQARACIFPFYRAFSMNKLKTIAYRIFPEHAFIPVITVIGIHFFAYLVPKLVNLGRPHMLLKLPLDDLIPFTPVFIVFYVLAFIQWAVYYLRLAREDRPVMRKYLIAGAISKLVCMILFVAVPSAVDRPEVTVNGVFTWCCKVVFFFDVPNNVFPSMHCLESWLCMRLAIEEFKLGRVPELARSIKQGYTGEMIKCINRKEWNRIKQDPEKKAAAEAGEIYVHSHALLSSILTLLVLLSTVFIKQHYVLDVVSGVALAEISLAAGRIICKKDGPKPEND